MSTRETRASTSYARMLILAARNFRLQQDAARSVPLRTTEPKARGPLGAALPGS